MSATPAGAEAPSRRWDLFLTDADRAAAAQAGYGARMGFGRSPVLMIIDVTYAFCGLPGENLAQASATYRNACGAAAWDAVEVMAALVATARRSGVPVLYTRPAPGRVGGFTRGRWLDKNRRSREDLRPGPRALDIVDPLAPTGRDLVVDKEKPSAFFGTPVSAYLTDLGTDTVIVCGGVTSGCVRSTAIDAFSHNYRVAVVEEGTFDRLEAPHWINLFDMDQKYADVVGAAEVESYLATVSGPWGRGALSGV